MATLENQSLNSLDKTGETFQPIQPPRKIWTPIYKPPRQSYKISYRPRKISSKGAILVLFWIVLVNSGTGTPQTEHGNTKINHYQRLGGKCFSVH